MIFGVAAGESGLVAVGVDEPVYHRRAAVWVSPDGLTWTRIPHDPTIFGDENGEQEMGSIVGAGAGCVATGTSIWVLSDGISWTLVQDVPTPEPPPRDPTGGAQTCGR